MHLVLHRLEKHLGQLRIAVVVDAGGVDVGDLLVEEPLAGANVPDARQQFVEIVLPQRPSGLDALVVEREPLDQQLAEPCRGPLAELGAAQRADPVANGQNHLQVVVLEAALDLPVPLLVELVSNPYKLPPDQLSILVNASNMDGYILRCGLKQVCHLALGEPDGLPVQPYLKVESGILVDEDLPRR